jgi:hypothetical protein
MAHQSRPLSRTLTRLRYPGALGHRTAATPVVMTEPHAGLRPRSPTDARVPSGSGRAPVPDEKQKRLHRPTDDRSRREAGVAWSVLAARAEARFKL